MNRVLHYNKRCIAPADSSKRCTHRFPCAGVEVGSMEKTRWCPSSWASVMSVVILPSRIAPNAAKGTLMPLSIRRISDSPWFSTSIQRGCSVAPVYGDLVAWNFNRGASTSKEEHTNRTRSGTSVSEIERPSSMLRSAGSAENLWTRASCLRFGPPAIGSYVIPEVMPEPYRMAVTRSWPAPTVCC